MKKGIFYIMLLGSFFSFCSISNTRKLSVNESDTTKPILQKVIDYSDSKVLIRPVNSMVFYRSKIYYSSRDGIFVLDTKNQKSILVEDGLNKNAPNYNVFTKILVHKDKLYASNLFNGIFRFNYKNQKWVALKNGLTDTAFFDMISCNGVLYAPSEEHGLFSFNDDNDTWSPINGDKAHILKKCDCIDSVLWVGNAANELFRLNPKNNELKRIIQFREADKYNNQIIGIGVSGIEHINDTIYVGCHVSGLFKSTDNGLTWTKKPIKFVIGVLYKWQDYLFLSDYWGYKDGLYVLNKTNDEIQKIDLGLTDQKIYDVHCLNGIFYITNNQGIWKISSDDFMKHYLPSR